MTRRAEAFFLTGIGILFLLLTLNPLLFQSYWENEADYILHAQVSIREISRSLVPDQSAFYFFLLHGWMRIFGSGEGATRSLSVLFSIGALFFLYRLSIAISGDKRVGILAVAFSAVSSFLIEFSQEAKHWALFVFLTLSSLFFLYRWFQKNRLRDFFAFLFLGLLNLSACLYAFFVFPIQLIFAMSNGRWNPSAVSEKRGGRGKIAVQSAIFVSSIFIIVKFAHLWAGFQYVNSRGAHWGLPQQFPDFFIALHRQLFYYTEDINLPAVALIGLAVGYLLFLWGLCRMRLRDFFLISLLFLLPLVASYQIAGSSSIRNRYFIHLIPLFWLSVSLGVFSVKQIRFRWLAAGLVFLTCFLSLANYFKLHRKEDWKSAVAFLAPRLEPNDMVVITPYWVKAGFEFYLTAEDAPGLPGASGAVPARGFMPRAGGGEAKLSRPLTFRFLAANELHLKEISNFKRAWVVSVYAEAPVKEGNFPFFEQANFHKISVRGFDLTSQEVTALTPPIKGFDFRNDLESAQVSMISLKESVPISFPYVGREAFYLNGEEKGEGGEGLLFDYRSRYPLSPGPAQWNVAAKTVQKSEGVLREAIWSHPPLAGTLIIRYPRMRLGRKLSGFYGLTDLSVEHGKGPVRFAIYIGEERVFQILKGNSAGWKDFEIDTSRWAGQETDISFRTETFNNRWRHFCFNAFIPDEFGAPGASPP